MGPGSTLYCCPLGVQELLGPRRQVQPARARSKTGCRISDRVARGCWEGARAPPYPQTCPVSALPRFPQPHRPPWARVIEAYRRANLHAATFNPARGASVQHDLLQQAGPPIHACTASSAPSQKNGGPAATTAHPAPTPEPTPEKPGFAHPPQKRRCGPAPSTRPGVANGPPGAAPCTCRGVVSGFGFSKKKLIFTHRTIPYYNFFPHRQTRVWLPRGPRTPSSFRLGSARVNMFSARVNMRIYVFFEINGWATPTRPWLRPLERVFILSCCRCAAGRSSRSSSTTPT